MAFVSGIGLKRGMEVMLHKRKGVVHSIDRSKQTASLYFPNEIPQKYSLSEIHRLYVEGKLILDSANGSHVNSIDSELTQLQKTLITQRTPYVIPLFEERSPTSRATRKRIAEKAATEYPAYPPISSNMQYKLYKQVEQLSGAMVGLLDRTNSKKSKQFLDVRQKDIVEKLYAEKFKVSLESEYRQKEFLEDLNNQIRDVNTSLDLELHIPQVSQPAISRYLKKKRLEDPLGWIAARKGYQALRRELSGTGQVHRASRILECAQIDFTVLDLVIVDIDRLVVLGQPTLGTLKDEASGSFLGFAIGWEGESTNLAAKLLRNAIIPKDSFLANFPEVKNEWPCHGIPRTIKTDLGSAFISDAFNDICDRLGISRINMPAASPWLKGAVESNFRTINSQLLTHFPAHTQRDSKIRSLVQQGKVPVVDAQEFYTILLKWICDIYQCEKHSEPGKIPNIVWREQEEVFPPTLPKSIDVLDVILGMTKHNCTLATYGIQIHYLRYNSRDLVELRERLDTSNRKVTIKHHPDDLGFIHVYNRLDDCWIRVDCTHSAYAARLTLKEHKMYRKHLSDLNESDSDIEMLVKAKRDIQQLVKSAQAKLRSKAPYRGAKADRELLRRATVASSDWVQRDREIVEMHGALIEAFGVSKVENYGISQTSTRRDSKSFNMDILDKILGDLE